MNQQIALAWSAALRSGKYRSNAPSNLMRIEDRTSFLYSYSPIGVLHDIIGESYIDTTLEVPDGQFQGDLRRFSDYMPCISILELHTLLGLPFEEIAKVIEENWEYL